MEFPGVFFRSYNNIWDHLLTFLYRLYSLGKELYACSLAISSFQSILDTLGGSKEKERARLGTYVLFNQ